MIYLSLVETFFEIIVNVQTCEIIPIAIDRCCTLSNAFSFMFHQNLNLITNSVILKNISLTSGVLIYLLQ